MSSSESLARDDLPSALQVWDNTARLAVLPGLLVWLAVLVGTLLCSVFFVADHQPPRWILGGLVASHLLVVVFATLKLFTMRVGVVSWTHVTCWSPGLVAAILEVRARGLSVPAEILSYETWIYAVITVILISFFFDVRDAASYLYHQVRRL